MAELNRPVYEALVTDEETGMLRISLVDIPAVESNFLAFAKEGEKPAHLYFVKDEEKRIVRGVVMRADYPILRRNGDYEYFIVFRADTIRVMAEKYLAESRQNKVDEMHNHEDVDEVRMVQYFIKDTAAGIAPAGFEDIADGSLFAEFHVLNDEVWEKVKDGTYRGFSLEGAFELAPEQMKAIPKTDTNMSKIKRFKAALARMLAEFGNISTDKGVLAWDGDEDLKAGDAVYIEDQEGNRETAPDGDYVTSDNKTIVVADGKVAEIRDPEAQVAPENPAQEENKEVSEDFRRVQTKFQETYDDKMNAIAEAIRLLGFMDFYIVEAGEEYAIAGVWTPEGEVFYKFIIREWREDGTVDLENGEVVVPTYVAPEGEKEPEPTPAPEPTVDEEKAALRAENEELRAQVETLTAKVAELSRTPMAKPAHEEAKDAAPNFRQTGIKGLDRIASLMKK